MDASQPARAPVPALPLTSCATSGKLHNHFLPPFAACEVEIIIATASQSHCEERGRMHSHVHCGCCYGCHYLCYLDSLRKEGYYDSPPLSHVRKLSLTEAVRPPRLRTWKWRHRT